MYAHVLSLSNSLSRTLELYSLSVIARTVTPTTRSSTAPTTATNSIPTIQALERHLHPMRTSMGTMRRKTMIGRVFLIQELTTGVKREEQLNHWGNQVRTTLLKFQSASNAMTIWTSKMMIKTKKTWEVV